MRSERLDLPQRTLQRVRFGRIALVGVKRVGVDEFRRLAFDALAMHEHHARLVPTQEIMNESDAHHRARRRRRQRQSRKALDETRHQVRR